MMQLLGDRVLVALPPSEEKVSPAGLVLVTDPDRLETPTRGIVMQLGRKSNTCDLDDVRSEVHTYFVERDSFPAIGRELGDEIDRVLMRLAPAPFDVQLGDCVIFGLGAGQAFDHDGIDYVILREAEIIGIVQEQKGQAA